MHFVKKNKKKKMKQGRRKNRINDLFVHFKGREYKYNYFLNTYAFY